MNERAVRVSVVVVNFNRRDMLLDCLKTLQQQRFPDLGKIIVVDNGSNDGSAQAVREQAKDNVILIENETNLGFAGGNNLGLRRASGEWVALINNDAMADPRWIAEMYRAAQASPDIGMVACRILSAAERDKIDNVGVGLWYDGMSRGLARGKKDSGLFEEDHRVLIPSGCAMLLRRQMLEEIGLFDESFFAYAEDTDLGLRGRCRGFKCVFAPRAVVYHHYSGTAGAQSPLKAFFAERNRIWILLRFYPLREILLSPLFTLLRYIFLAISARKKLNSASNSKTGTAMEIAQALIKAYSEAFRHLSEQLRVRRGMREKGQVDDIAFRNWLKSHQLDFSTLTEL